MHNATTERQTEILWDEWGVPHIYGPTDDDVSYGMGWAQARAHTRLLLQLYGIARGCAAQYWGAAYRDSDITALTLDLPTLGAHWFAAQKPSTRTRVAAFCAGINDWLAAHPETAGEYRKVLPITGSDIYAHLARNLLSYSTALSDAHTQVLASEHAPPAGSNAWAVASHRARNGNGLLLCNPHVPWRGRYIFFEAHQISPGRDFYGIAPVGAPWAWMGFNPTAGWAHGINPADLLDVYRLTVDGDGYHFDGQHHEFDTVTRSLLIRRGDGELDAEPLIVRRSVHGPVLTASDGTLVAVRIAGLTTHTDSGGQALEAWWNMSKANTVTELAATMHLNRLPMFTVLAADRSGHVGGIYAGLIPRRDGTTADWTGFLPGDDPAWLWNDLHNQQELPHILNPDCGFVHDTNDAPWTLTAVPTLDPNDYPATIAPPPGLPGFRALAALEHLDSAAPVSLEDLITLKYATHVRLADHVLDDLLAAAATRADTLVTASATVLAAWDRHAHADSAGAVLFFLWAQQLLPAIVDGSLFAYPWDPHEPYTTPRGLAEPQHAVSALHTAATQLTTLGHTLDTTPAQAWHTSVHGNETPAEGGPSELGVLKTLTVSPIESDRAPAVFGDVFTVAVEFSRPIRAYGLLIHGNFTEAGDPAPGEQLKLAASGELRELHLTRWDCERNLHEHEVLVPPETN